MEPPAQLEAAQIAHRIESARNLLLKVAICVVGLLMLLLGAVLFRLALPAVVEWGALSGILRAILVFWLIAGPVCLGCGILLIVSLGRYAPPLWVGSAALIASGTLMIAGVLTHVIPCAGPT